jgi:hypothetical protein
LTCFNLLLTPRRPRFPSRVVNNSVSALVICLPDILGSLPLHPTLRGVLKCDFSFGDSSGFPDAVSRRADHIPVITIESPTTCFGFEMPYRAGLTGSGKVLPRLLIFRRRDSFGEMSWSAQQMGKGCTIQTRPDWRAA